MVPHLRAEIGGAVLGGEGLPPLGAVLGVENNVTLQDAVYQLNAIRGCRPLRALHLFAGAGGSVLAGRLLGWPSARWSWTRSAAPRWSAMESPSCTGTSSRLTRGRSGARWTWSSGVFRART